ncbi:hypothetical protein [Pseudarthrobacter sp. ATCC 49987]|uniref:hypothetical protein n=1 Tax=Pseudarthrobacter sp. ATCC 49987 TaxID=2698204 RepID=UPI001F3F00C4|nr:hypothetical protein [Pseudarthrobacter sp. ATCC 49987]
MSLKPVRATANASAAGHTGETVGVGLDEVACGLEVPAGGLVVLAGGLVVLQPVSSAIAAPEREQK